MKNEELRDKFRILRRRIYLARWLRGLGSVTGALVVIFVSAFVVDWLIGPSNFVLGLWFLAFVVGGAALAVRRLVRPLFRRVGDLALAGLVEKHYPALGERLTSAVGLPLDHAQSHGAPALIALLREDAARLAAPLDMAPVFSLASAKRRFGLAVLLLLIALAPVFLSSSYAYFGQRFLRSWLEPLVGYHMEIAPGNGVRALGRQVVIEVKLISEDTRVLLPKACYLALPAADGAPRRTMQADKDHFTFTLEKLPGDLVYRIEAGELQSELFRLTAAAPIELAPGSPRIEATPPSYVDRGVHPVATSAAGGDFSALQFSIVRFGFRFNHTPRAVRLQVKKEGERQWLAPALHWNGDEAFVEIPAAQVGVFTGILTMESEHGIKTMHVLPRWRIWPDEPPVFTRAPGMSASSTDENGPEGARTALPDDVIPLRSSVEDQVGVESLGVEYGVNDGPSTFEVVVKGDGKRTLHIDAAFPLLGKVKDGDILRWRLRALDNRRLSRGQAAPNVPDHDLAPNATYQPPIKDGSDQFYVLKISSQADPLQKQQIIAQRGATHELVGAIKKELTEERAQLDKALTGGASVTGQAAQALGGARALNATIEKDLALLRLHAMDEPALTALAELALDLADGELVRSAEHLAQAERQRSDGAARDQQLKKADAELSQALTKLDELSQLNERLARDRLDQVRVEQLAHRQEKLTKSVGAIVAKDRGKDGAKAGALLVEQAKIARDLDDVAEESRLFAAGKQKGQAAANMEESAVDKNARSLTVKAFQDGRQQVANSRKLLEDGISRQAEQAAQRAAQALANAAQAALAQMTRGASASGSANTGSAAPGQTGAPGAKQAASGLLSSELDKYQGKSWGQLPGALRTRLLQDLSARYGDDYAPIIQRYFQELANVPAQ